MKSLLKTVFFVYILVLLWLVLFKTSLDIPSVLTDHIRSLNLIPFTGHLSEMTENFIIFIPFGLLLSAAFKKVTFWQKLTIILVFSLAIETTQYILSIGISDITDVITNTLGGLFGLVAYAIIKNYKDSKKLDRIIAVVIVAFMVLFVFLRLFVFKVRY